MHERLQNSQIRTDLENRVRQIIIESGGVDNVNLETLVERIRGNK
jgi:predicted  nucleic acid-binding Zn-ribbon protein